jgi:hypothetical protein
MVTGPGAAGWRHPGEEFHDGDAGRWAMSVVRTTALDRNSGMSAVGRRSRATSGTSEGRRSSSAHPAARSVRPRRGGVGRRTRLAGWALPRPCVGAAFIASAPSRLHPPAHAIRTAILAGSSPEVQFGTGSPSSAQNRKGVMLIVINPFLVVGVTWHARELAPVAARSVRADNDWEEARKDGPRAG